MHNEAPSSSLSGTRGTRGRACERGTGLAPDTGILPLVDLGSVARGLRPEGDDVERSLECAVNGGHGRC